MREYTSGSLLKLRHRISRMCISLRTPSETIFGLVDRTRGEDEIIAVAKKTCCHDFIMTLPDGYQTKIGEGGSSLSGEEKKQRISIARQF